MTIVAIYSNKGGVGKTAAAVNLAYLAAQSSAVTLLCDLDAQGSSTYYFRIKPGIKRKARGLTKGSRKIDASIKSTDYANLDLLPADFSHRNLDITYDKAKKSTSQLRKVLKPLESTYEFLFLDCPPTLNLLAENVFGTADHVLVPLIPTTLSLRAHEQLLSFSAQAGYGSERIFAFFSMVDGRKKMHRELIAYAQDAFGNVLEAYIPYLSHVEQMGLYQAPVSTFAANTPAAWAYDELWDEVRGRMLGFRRQDAAGE